MLTSNLGRVMAQQFSAALDNVFGLDGNDDRSQALEEKYAAVFLAGSLVYGVAAQ